MGCCHVQNHHKTLLVISVAKKIIEKSLYLITNELVDIEEGEVLILPLEECNISFHFL